MPQATRTKATFKFDLKSVPEGFVELRKLSYGEVLEQQEVQARMGQSSGKNGKGPGIEVRMQYLAAQVFAFGRSVVDHNLEDETGKKLNLGKDSDVASLEAGVGDEIETLINELNSPEDTGPLGNNSGEPSDLIEVLKPGPQK